MVGTALAPAHPSAGVAVSRSGGRQVRPSPDDGVRGSSPRAEWCRTSGQASADAPRVPLAVLARAVRRPGELELVFRGRGQRPVGLRGHFHGHCRSPSGVRRPRPRNASFAGSPNRPAGFASSMGLRRGPGFPPGPGIGPAIPVGSTTAPGRRSGGLPAAGSKMRPARVRVPPSDDDRRPRSGPMR